jgi:hypothetical protein
MKTKLFAAVVAALTLASVGAASAQDFRRGGDHRATITVQKDGRTMNFNRGDRTFYRLIDQGLRPGLTYRYTDRCNRNGCVAFVFDNRHRRPIDRIFAPHIRHGHYAWRQARDFDGNYGRYGRYDRDDRNDGWRGEDDRINREWRGRDRDDDRRDDRDDRGRGDRSGLEGGPR